jgi:hypothetical protein
MNFSFGVIYGRSTTFTSTAAVHSYSCRGFGGAETDRRSDIAAQQQENG